MKRVVFVCCVLCITLLTGCTEDEDSKTKAFSNKNEFILSSFDNKDVTDRELYVFNDFDTAGPMNSGVNVESSSDATDVSTDSKEDTSTGKSGTNFKWPLSGYAPISCGFGKRVAPTAGASTNHKGIDIGVPQGTKIKASAGGTVIAARWQDAKNHKIGAGLYVCIDHGNGMQTIYMHTSRLRVKTGQKVSQGEVIALSGNTGVSTGPHLHFGISKNGVYENPLKYVKQPSK